MSLSPSTRSRAASRRGGVTLTQLLLGGAVLLLAVLAFITLSGPTTNPTAGESGGQPAVAAMPSGPKPAELEMPEGGPLPGQGPLEIQLHYLGQEGDSHLRPSYPGSLEGIVYGPEGEGLADARLQVLGGPQDGLVAIADAEGHYRFPELLPGTLFLRLESSQTAPAGRLQRILSKAPTRRDFFVGQPITIRLRILGHDGKPLADAQLDVDFGARRFTTDKEGVALLDQIASGRRVVVGIEAVGHVPVRYELNLFPQQQTGEPIDLPPLPQGGRLRGKVSSWPGGDLPRVTLVPRGTSPGPYLYQWERWQELPTDPSGRFDFDDLPTTELIDVRVSHPWGSSEPRSRSVRPGVAAAATVSFLIREDRATVSGEVTDEAGQALPGANLTLTAAQPTAVLQALYPGLTDSPLGVRLPQPAALLRRTKSDRHGEFRFALGDHPQGTGRLILTATAPGRATIHREARTVGQTFRLALPPAAPPATLSLQRSDGGPLPPALWLVDNKPTQADDQGRLKGLVPGRYHVVVRRGELELLRQEAFLIEGASALDLSRH